MGEGSWGRPQASPRVTGDFPPALGTWGSQGHKVTAPLPPRGTPHWAFSIHFLRSPGTPPHSLSFRSALPPPTLGISIPALLWLTKGDLGQADTLRPLNSERERGFPIRKTRRCKSLVKASLLNSQFNSGLVGSSEAGISPWVWPELCPHA